MTLASILASTPQTMADVRLAGRSGIDGSNAFLSLMLGNVDIRNDDAAGQPLPIAGTVLPALPGGHLVDQSGNVPETSGTVSGRMPQETVAFAPGPAAGDDEGGKSSEQLQLQTQPVSADATTAVPRVFVDSKLYIESISGQTQGPSLTSENTGGPVSNSRRDEKPVREQPEDISASVSQRTTASQIRSVSALSTLTSDLPAGPGGDTHSTSAAVKNEPIKIPYSGRSESTNAPAFQSSKADFLEATPAVVSYRDALPQTNGVSSSPGETPHFPAMTDAQVMSKEVQNAAEPVSKTPVSTASISILQTPPFAPQTLTTRARTAPEVRPAALPRPTVSGGGHTGDPFKEATFVGKAADLLTPSVPTAASHLVNAAIPEALKMPGTDTLVAGSKSIFVAGFRPTAEPQMASKPVSTGVQTADQSTGTAIASPASNTPPLKVRAPQVIAGVTVPVRQVPTKAKRTDRLRVVPEEIQSQALSGTVRRRAAPDAQIPSDATGLEVTVPRATVRPDFIAQGTHIPVPGTPLPRGTARASQVPSGPSFSTAGMTGQMVSTPVGNQPVVTRAAANPALQSAPVIKPVVESTLAADSVGPVTSSAIAPTPYKAAGNQISNDRVQRPPAVYAGGTAFNIPTVLNAQPSDRNARVQNPAIVSQPVVDARAASVPVGSTASIVATKGAPGKTVPAPTAPVGIQSSVVWQTRTTPVSNVMNATARVRRAASVMLSDMTSGRIPGTAWTLVSRPPITPASSVTDVRAQAPRSASRIPASAPSSGTPTSPQDPVLQAPVTPASSVTHARAEVPRSASVIPASVPSSGMPESFQDPVSQAPTTPASSVTYVRAQAPRSVPAIPASVPSSGTPRSFQDPVSGAPTTPASSVTYVRAQAPRSASTIPACVPSSGTPESFQDPVSQAPTTPASNVTDLRVQAPRSAPAVQARVTLSGTPRSPQDAILQTSDSPVSNAPNSNARVPRALPEIPTNVVPSETPETAPAAISPMPNTPVSDAQVPSATGGLPSDVTSSVATEPAPVPARAQDPTPRVASAPAVKRPVEPPVAAVSTEKRTIETAPQSNAQTTQPVTRLRSASVPASPARVTSNSASADMPRVIAEVKHADNASSRAPKTTQDRRPAVSLSELPQTPLAGIPQSLAPAADATPPPPPTSPAGDELPRPADTSEAPAANQAALPQFTSDLAFGARIVEKTSDEPAAEDSFVNSASSQTADASLNLSAQPAPPQTSGGDAGHSGSSVPHPEGQRKETARQDRPSAPTTATEQNPTLKSAEATNPTATVQGTSASARAVTREPVAETQAAQTAGTPVMEPRPAQPVRDVTLRLTTDNQQVDVKLIDRHGELHVAVQSADPVLATDLRASVHDLIGGLEKNGFHADVWQPGEARQTPGAAASGARNAGDQPQGQIGEDPRRQGRNAHNPEYAPSRRNRGSNAEWMKEMSALNGARRES